MNSNHPMNGMNSIQESLKLLNAKHDQNHSSTKRHITSTMLELKHGVEEDLEKLNQKIQDLESNVETIINNNSKFQSPTTIQHKYKNTEGEFIHHNSFSPSTSQTKRSLNFVDEMENSTEEYVYGKGLFVPVFDKFDAIWNDPLTDSQTAELSNPTRIVSCALEVKAYFIKTMR
jgi:hypothetical protein